MKRLIIAAIGVDVVMSSICIALWLVTEKASFLTGLFCAQFLAIGAFVIFLAHKTYRENREQMRLFAQQNRMQLIESTEDSGVIRDEGIIPHLSHLDVFVNYQAMAVSPLLQRNDNGRDLAVFQLLYLPHPTRHRVARTAVAIRDPSLQLPAFTMCPKQLAQKRFQEITEDSDMVSFETHVYDGELKANQVWDQRAEAYFRQNEDLYVEGGEDVVIVYRKQTDVAGWPDIIRQTFEVFEMLKSLDTAALQTA